MWLSVALVTDAGHADALADALLARGALSVTVEDADSGTARETAQFGEPGSAAPSPWPASRLSILVEPAAELGRMIAEAAAQAGLGVVPEYAVEELAEQDWVRVSRAQFVPARIGERLWIVPSWLAPPDPSAINVVLDPGMAFGTGSHATTRLCLEWLLAQVGRGASVLDYGCGSGILAVAAAKLGAARVVAVDIDEQALRAAADNAARNAARIEFVRPHARIAESFDLVVANILTKPLQLLAPVLCARLAPGGRLALSGVLESQAASVQESYRPWIALAVGAVDDGWVRLEGRLS